MSINHYMVGGGACHVATKNKYFFFYKNKSIFTVEHVFFFNIKYLKKVLNLNFKIVDY